MSLELPPNSQIASVKEPTYCIFDNLLIKEMLYAVGWLLYVGREEPKFEQ